MMKKEHRESSLKERGEELIFRHEPIQNQLSFYEHVRSNILNFEKKKRKIPKEIWLFTVFIIFTTLLSFMLMKILLQDFTASVPLLLLNFFNCIFLMLIYLGFYILYEKISHPGKRSFRSVTD